MSDRKVLHLIGNAHLDPVWLWRWPEGFEAARATFQSVLDLMDENPEFVFTSSQAAVYQWIERGDPELFVEIKARVQEGRWRIVGGWWVQADCNIPSGESLVRQGLYGQRYFQAKLGMVATVGYNVDSFGHNRMLPQILKRSGMNSYVFMRPETNENPNIPGRLFWWESPDGTRVLAYQIPYSYCSSGESMEEKLRLTVQEMDNYPEMMEFYGVGNHGGGPTRENLARIKKLEADESLPELRHSSPDQFFESILSKKPDLPVWRDELQYHARGCYACHSQIKKDNRLLETLLEAAEKFSVIACLCAGLKYPQEELTRAWHAVLFNQFHDILMGTSIPEACNDARDLHGLAYQAANEALTFAVGALASKVNTSGEGLPLVVFNPLSWSRKDHCECELQDFGATVRIEDDQGDPVPCQIIEPSAVVTADWRTRVCFQVEVDGMGYRLYRAFPENEDFSNPLSVTSSSLENVFLRIAVDPETGQLAGVFDKKNRVQVLSAPVTAKVICDPSDTWSHGVSSFPDVIGYFAGAELQVVERGPVRAVIRATSRYSNSTLVQEYRLYGDSDRLECRCHVCWHEQHKMLKLGFPVNLKEPLVTYEIPYGHIHRAGNGEEQPGLSWVDVGTEDYGLCVVNDSKYSYDVMDGTINLTVLRSPIYAHHEPREPDPDGCYTYIDQGYSHFTYRLVPHTGSWRETFPHRLGAESSAPLVAVVQSQHTGKLPARGHFISVSADNVIVSAVKRAEDGSGIILRCFETHGLPTVCTFSLAQPQRTWESKIGPCEIKTFLIAENEVKETDLLENVIP